MDDREILGDVPLGRLGGYCVLVVDDDEEIRTFLTTLMTDEGAAALQAADGDEALATAIRAKPDLITLDLSMPGRDGIETFCDLRQNPATEQIPVCIITGHPEFRTVIYDRPVTPPEGFIEKPCDPEHVVKTIRRILGLGKRKRARAFTNTRDG
ncbi:MAG: response regulator [Acidobacteria bacterium]|nr:response regulator [Candidatus Sulfomarinibacter sp. MAG AM1]